METLLFHLSTYRLTIHYTNKNNKSDNHAFLISVATVESLGRYSQFQVNVFIWLFSASLVSHKLLLADNSM